MLIHLFIYQSTYLTIYLAFNLSTFLSICHFFSCCAISLYLSVYLHIYLFRLLEERLTEVMGENAEISSKISKEHSRSISDLRSEFTSEMLVTKNISLAFQVHGNGHRIREGGHIGMSIALVPKVL